MVEQAAVNRSVDGSNPSRGAMFLISQYIIMKSFLYLYIPYLIINLISRLFLFTYSYLNKMIEFNFTELGKVLVFGIFNDTAPYILFIVPFIAISLFISNRIKQNKYYKYTILSLVYLFIVALVFNAFAEFLFWEEFQTKFNFIAVDYLIYTTEVIDNIVQSYPLVQYLTVIFLISIALYIAFFKFFRSMVNTEILKKDQYIRLTIAITAYILVLNFYHTDYTNINGNTYLSELNKNGIYNLFSAYINNSLNYKSFYKNIPDNQAFEIVKKELIQSNQKYISQDEYSIERSVSYQGKTKLYNVVLIVVESLSHHFIGKEVEGYNITPYLSEISKKSINFTEFYATGTRTVRGLESITLSVPPTPGNSVVRRPNNENLFSISSVLRKHNFDMQFLYGGFGYFDNMNYFFENNGFRIIDRNKIKKDDIIFANAWGVADEVLFDQALKQADISFQNKQNFFQFIMTTSNHRPFTFPENRIDLKSGSGRFAAVKYTDYAIGKFLEKASSKPWYDNTIFVITADHCASSAGKTDLPIDRYHIPLFIFSPKNIEPNIISKISSQIDLAPTILGLMNIEYNSKFFGNDILTKQNDNLVLGTYQLLGFYQKNKFAILAPQNKYNIFKVKDFEVTEQIQDLTILNKAISYYQTSSYLLDKHLKRHDSN